MSEQNYSTAFNLGKSHPAFLYSFDTSARNGSGEWQPFGGKSADDPSYWVYNNYTTGTVAVLNSAGLKSSVIDLEVFAPLSGDVEKAVISYVGNSASNAALDAIITFANPVMSGLSPQRDGTRLSHGTIVELSPSEYNNSSLLMEPVSGASGVFGYFSLSFYKRS
jgi:hypothetical protein